MNQSMAVAYATLGSEFLALMLSVVMVKTVVTPRQDILEKNTENFTILSYCYTEVDIIFAFF